MKESLLCKKLKGKKVACFTCQRRCTVAPGKWGYCQTRINKNGKLYSVIYNVVSSVNVDPIEKKPVFHYKPGSPCLSLGTYGCNFRCKFCQNWLISHVNGGSLNIDNEKALSAKEAISLAKKSNAQGVAWTYNEPAIWLEYCLDGAKLAKGHHLRGEAKPKTGEHLGGELYTCWVTNGFATPEAIDAIAPYLNIYRVDLKSFSDRLYQKLIKVPQAAGVFKTLKYVHDKYPKIHIECITNVVPTWNDSQDNLKRIANWIIKNISPKTPWHVTRFFPYADLSDVPPTPPETLFKARKLGMKEGLDFVYIGNMSVDKEDDTFCPKCGNLAIRRTGYSVEVLGVNKDGRCEDCGEDLNITI